MPRRRALGSSAKARSITSARGCRCRRPRRTASRRSTRCSRSKPRPRARRSRLRRHRVPDPRRRGDLPVARRERVGHAGEPAAGGAATWLRSPCLGLCEQAPAALVQAAGTAAGRLGAGADDARRDRRGGDRRDRVLPGAADACAVGPADHGAARPSAAPAAARRRRESREPRRLSRARRLRGAAARARDRARARAARGARRPSWSAAAAPRFRPDASGKPSPGRRCGRTTWSATPTNPSRAPSRTAS